MANIDFALKRNWEKNQPNFALRDIFLKKIAGGWKRREKEKEEEESFKRKTFCFVRDCKRDKLLLFSSSKWDMT